MRTLGLISVYCKRNFYYPAVSLIAIVNTFIVFIIQASLWGKILQERYEFYFALIMLISTFTAYTTERDIASEYQDGGITVQLIKPLSYMRLKFIADLSQAVAAFLLRTLPVLVLLVIWNRSVLLGFQGDPVPFTASVILAALMSWLIAYTIGIAVVYSGSNEGLIQAKNLIVMLLSGAVIPYNVFPEAVLQAIRLTPFAGLYILPYEAATQKNSASILLLQAFWLTVMLAVSLVVNRNAMKQIVCAGG